MKSLKCVSADMLKILAMVCMVLDHLWATIVPDNQWMNMVGRLTFPLFAFLIAEGYTHTSNFKKYALRLLIFGVISEIPFNFIMSGSWFFPFHQNVMFTMLLGLLCIRAIDKFKENRTFKRGLLSALIVVGCLLLSIIGFVDYGLIGVLTIIVFYVFRHFKFAWACQFVALSLMYIVFFKGQSIIIPLGNYEYFFPIQGFGVLALIPIWLYNGKRYIRNKIWQYSVYAFYPLHMALIYGIYRLAF